MILKLKTDLFSNKNGTSWYILISGYLVISVGCNTSLFFSYLKGKLIFMHTSKSGLDIFLILSWKHRVYKNILYSANATFFFCLQLDTM